MTNRRAACLLLILATTLLGFVPPASAAPDPTPASPSPSRTITPGHSRLPHGGTTTTGQGLRPSNNGAQLSENIPSRVRRSWAVSPKSKDCPYNGTEDRTYNTKTTATNGPYTVALHQGPCSIVTAYRTKNGKRVWKAEFLRARALVSDGTYVYVHAETVVDVPVVIAIKIKTGKVRWVARTGDAQDELVVGAGVVVHGIQVLDAKTGKLRFFIPSQSMNSHEPRTLVVDGTLYRNNHDVVDAWTPKGRFLWRYTKDTSARGPGDGELLPQYHAGRIYVRDDLIDGQGTLVLDAKTGRRLPDVAHTALPMAFDGHVGIVTAHRYEDPDKTRVSAVDLRDGYVYWTRTYAWGTPEVGQILLSTPPIVENGLVWFGLVGPSGGGLVALDEVTGETRSVQQKCRLAGQDAREGVASQGTIGVAQHRLFVSSACGLQTFVAKR